MLGQARDLSAEMRSTADLRGGLSALTGDRFDVVLMDLSVPDGAGLGNVSLIKAEAPQLPIIVAGEANDETVALEAVHAGAHDYLVKNQLNPGWLERSIRYAIERHRMDRTLLAAEARYHSVFAHLVEGIFQTTPEGHYLMANVALARIYGYNTPEELMSSLTDISRSLYAQEGRRAEFVRVMQEHDTITGFESQVYRKDGSVIWISENCRAVRDAKRRLGSATPRLVWEFHVFRHNTEDIEQARALAHELEMDIAVDKGWVVGSEWDTEGKFRYYADPTPHRCPFLWTQAVINNDGGVAPCCGTFFHEDDMGALAAERAAPGARSFREVWNNPKFRASRRLFRSRTGSPDEQQLACYECPITKIWENYGQHVAAGGTRETFQVGYSTNDCFNYFWNRRPVPPAAASAGGRPAALAR